MDVSLAGLSRGAAPSPVRAASTAPTVPAATAPPAAAEPIKARTVLGIVSDILAIPLVENSLTPQPLTPVRVPEVTGAGAPASGPPGAACDIAGAIQIALREDPDIHAAVLLIPRKALGVANAMIMWNGAWVAPAAAGDDAAFARIDTGVRQIIANAQPDCRDQTIVGPRFMLVPEGDATMVVVFGNASWRWADLLVGADVPTPS